MCDPPLILEKPIQIEDALQRIIRENSCTATCHSNDN